MAKSKKPEKPKRDEEREARILMEIVVDAHDEEERAMGWYCYLQNILSFPFLTRCINERATSPLRVGDEVEVVGMAPEDEREKEHIRGESLPEMYKRTFSGAAVTVLKVVHGNEQTHQAIDDWHYWVGMGYEF